ncbi:MAG: MFS transporter, partial [Propionibacteriaceae bacterium]|nr:MFS transporter [Propionibacteriaceae bacterium]
MTRTAAPSPATNPAQRFPRSLLLPMMIGCILNPINSSIIAVALIPIGAFFGAPPSQTTWLVSALYVATAIGQPLTGRLVTAIGQPLTGRLVDRYGPKRLFLIGSGLVGIAGVIGMLAPNLWVLVVARVILGFGTCAGYPSAMALIRKVSDRQGIISPAGVLTALTVTTQTISVIGPTLGGVLIDVGGWRATLAINVPLAIAALLLGWFLLPAYADEGTSSGGAGIDWGGIGLFCGMLIALLVFLMNLRMAFAWALVVAIVVGVGFVLRERRTDDPFIDLRMLAGNRPLIATYVRGFAMSTVSYSFLYGVSQWVEEGRGLTPSQTGLMLLPTFGTAIVFS